MRISTIQQPDWVCHECGTLWGAHVSPTRLSTCHEGECGVCGERKIVTEARDYGYLVKGWQRRRRG